MLRYGDVDLNLEEKEFKDEEEEVDEKKIPEDEVNQF